MTSISDVTSSTNGERLTGRVKWFNNKAGYGFITATDGAHVGTDVFTHHSAINVANQQYRYLVQGEYVDFDLVNVESDKYKFHAGKVNGVKGGKLMCETRNEIKASQTSYKKENTLHEEEISVKAISEPSRTPRTPRAPRTQSPEQRVRNTAPKVRSHGEGPREENKDWNVVAKKPSTAPRKRRVQATTTSE
jgi:CspA family cold shock protein